MILYIKLFKEFIKSKKLINIKRLSIGIIGMGYNGITPLASAFSRKFKVLGYDVDKNRISQLKAGIDITSEIKNLKKNNKNLQFYYDIKHLKNCKIFCSNSTYSSKK